MSENISRRQFLRATAATISGLTLAACGVKTPDNPIENTPTPQFDRLAEEVFDTQLYRPEFASTIENWWLHGLRNGEPTLINLPNGKKLGISIPAHTENPSDIEASASTNIGFTVRQGSDQTHIIFSTYQGNLSSKYEQFDPQMQKALREVDIKHETLITLSAMYVVDSVLSSHGIDAGKTLESQGVTLEHFRDHIFPTVEKIISTSHKYSEAVSELQDYILLYKIVNKNGTGDPQYVPTERDVNSDGTEDTYFIPVLGDIAQDDGGFFHLIDTTMGRTLREITSYEELTTKYRHFTEIPGFEKYFAELDKRVSIQ